MERLKFLIIVGIGFCIVYYGTNALTKNIAKEATDPSNGGALREYRSGRGAQAKEFEEKERKRLAKLTPWERKAEEAKKRQQK